MDKHRLLAFNLNSGIWPHTMLLTKTLGQLNPDVFDVHFLSCGTLFSRTCTVMESRKRAFNETSSPAKFDCADCTFTANLSGHWIGRKGLSSEATSLLSNFLSEDHRYTAGLLSQKLSDGELDLEYKFEGIPIVRFALYETILKYKKLDIRLSELEIEHFRSLLENCIRTILSGRVFLTKTRSFDSVVIHSTEYGANNSFASLASQFGIPVFNLRGSLNLAEMESSVVIHDWNFEPSTHLSLRSWKTWREVLPAKSELKRVQEHIGALYAAKSPFVYSPRARRSFSTVRTRKVLGIENTNPNILLSINSTDEIIASKTIGRGLASNYPGSVFTSQFDWVSQTIEWASQKSDLNLILRLHPRDLPNKRESVTSEQHQKWMQLFTEKPENVYINHPSQGLSFRDVCLVSSVVATGWSATALEALVLGRPVVTYDNKLPALPADIHKTGASPGEYFENLNQAVHRKPDSQNVEMAHNWMVHSLTRGAVQLTGGLFQTLRQKGPTLIRMGFSGLDRFFYRLWRPLELAITFRKTQDSLRIEDLFRLKKPDFYT